MELLFFRFRWREAVGGFGSQYFSRRNSSVRGVALRRSRPARWPSARHIWSVPQGPHLVMVDQDGVQTLFQLVETGATSDAWRLVRSFTSRW